jgi:protein-tyrosine phosphatase
MKQLFTTLTFVTALFLSNPALSFTDWDVDFAFSPDEAMDMGDELLNEMMAELMEEDEYRSEFFSKKNNTHLIDQNKNTGYALYRVSKPNANDMKRFCELGITEMLVLSGTADKHEWRFQSACPELEVVANLDQLTVTPVDVDFLTFFDNWVQDAMVNGKKIAFRCECGCHRTGRLAAYYQMRYQGLSLREARREMTRAGKYMWLFPHIYIQVNAIADHVNNRPCSTWSRFCVRD